MVEYLFGRARIEFSRFDRRLYILSAGWLVTSAGFAMVIPFLSIYFHLELGMSMSAIGVFFGVTSVLRAAPQPFVGWLSDRIGRVSIMGWSQILRSFTFAGVGVAIVTDSGFWVIAAIISANYILGAFLHPAANAMVAELVPKEDRISAFGLLRIAGNLGWAIGPAVGGILAHQSYGALFFVAAGIMFVSGLYFLIALSEVRPSARNDAPDFQIRHIFNLRRDGRLFEHCLISFVLFLAVAQLVAALSVYTVDSVGITKSQLGILYFINGFMVVVLQFPVSSLFKRMTLTGQLSLGAMVYAVGYFLVGLAPNFWFLIVCMVIITTAEMIVSPPSLTMVANLSPAGRYGRYMGIFGFFQTAGWSLGPTVGGGLLDLFAGRPIIMWLLISMLGIIAFVLFRNFGRRIPASVNSGLREKKEAVVHA